MKPAFVSFSVCLATLIWVAVSVGQQTNIGLYPNRMKASEMELRAGDLPNNKAITNVFYHGSESGLPQIPQLRLLTTNDLPTIRPSPLQGEHTIVNKDGTWVKVKYDGVEYMELAEPPEEEGEAEIVDLGVITNHRAILLSAATNRSDFLMFRIGLTAIGNAGMDTNFTTTNRILQAKDMRGIPFGPVLLGVRTVCEDGSESPVAIFRFELRTEGPRRPTASTTIVSGGIIATNESLKAMRERRKKAAAKDAGAPMPGVTGRASATGEPPPMTGGTNRVYDVEAMRKFFEQTNRR